MTGLLSPGYQLYERKRATSDHLRSLLKPILAEEFKGINSGTSEVLSKGITPVDHLQKTNTMMEDISADAGSFCPYRVHILLCVHSVPTAKLL